MSQVIYRKVEKTDFGQMTVLMSQLGYSLNETDIEKNTNEIRIRGGEVFVAEIEKLTVGCISAIIDVRLAAGTSGEIVSLVVLDKFRGQGVGRGLVKAAEKWLAISVTVIRVRANTIRDDAHRFYTSAGYRELKTQKIFQKNV